MLGGCLCIIYLIGQCVGGNNVCYRPVGGNYVVCQWVVGWVLIIHVISQSYKQALNVSLFISVGLFS